MYLIGARHFARRGEKPSQKPYRANRIDRTRQTHENKRFYLLAKRRNLAGRAAFRNVAALLCGIPHRLGEIQRRPDGYTVAFRNRTRREHKALSPSASSPIRILGVDPGLRITGFGVIEKTGNQLTYVASGCIKTDGKASLPTRLGTIHAGLRELAEKYRPDQAAVEIVFVNVNPQSTLLLGQARGAAITALVADGIEVAEYTALQVKQAVVGNGHADKIQVQHMIRRLLSLPGDPSPDAADALACAIAHAHGGQGLGHGLGALATKGLRVRNGRLIEG
jgi:crossover junction endodeoxyribonuclease RuvC